MKKNLPIITGPTWLTISRIVLATVFTILIMVPETWSRITALIVFIIAAITDRIDGNWARKTKTVTPLGTLLDPIADKMLVNLAFLTLVYLGVVPLWIFAIILVRDFAVDGMRIMLAQKQDTIAASFYGKAKTATQMFALIFLIANMTLQQTPIAIIGNILLYVALVLTIFSGADYIIKGYKKHLR